MDGVVECFGVEQSPMPTNKSTQEEMKKDCGLPFDCLNVLGIVVRLSIDADSHGSFCWYKKTQVILHL